jgi:hypothetical protein
LRRSIDNRRRGGKLLVDVNDEFTAASVLPPEEEYWEIASLRNLLIVVVALEFFLLETGIGMAADPELLLC